MSPRSPTLVHQPNIALGMALMVVAVLMFSLMDATAKGLVQHYNPAQVIWARFTGQLVLVLVLLRGAAPRMLRTPNPRLHLLRGLCQIGAITFFFLALTRIGIAEATAIADINPVLITLGAALFLGEKLGPRRLGGAIVALIGALIIIRPGTAGFTPWAILPFCCAICYTTNALLTRRFGRGEPVWTAMLWGAGLGMLATSAILPFVWTPVRLADLPFFLIVGLIGALAQLCMIRSFSMAEAGAVAPFAYLGIVFATVWDVLFFNRWPDLWTVIGALVIVGAGLYVWQREMMITRRKAA